jgi:hypothetical protein
MEQSRLMRNNRSVAQPMAPEVDKDNVCLREGRLESPGQWKHAQRWGLDAVDEEDAVWTSCFSFRGFRNRMERRSSRHQPIVCSFAVRCVQKMRWREKRSERVCECCFGWTWDGILWFSSTGCVFLRTRKDKGVCHRSHGVMLCVATGEEFKAGRRRFD